MSRLVIFLTVTSILMSGCGELDRNIGSIGAKHGSYDLRGERVTVTLLTEPEFKSYADQHKLDVSWVVKQHETEKVAMALIALIAPELIKLGYDFVVDQIKAEAARYEQQFSGSTFVGDFWLPSPDKPQIRYWGLLIERRTSKNVADKELRPAFTLLCAFIPRHKAQYIEIAPLYLDDARPKAKIVGDELDLKVTFTPKFQWVDANGAAQNLTLEPVIWEAKDLLLTDGPRKYNQLKSKPTDDVLTEQVPVVENRLAVGAFLSPPLTHTVDPAETDPAKKVVKPSGLVHMTVTVDEKDNTEAQAYVKRVQKIAEDNKDKVVKILVEAVVPATQPATKPAKEKPSTNPATQP